ncbi:DUF1870 family protein [Nocardia farcinica]|uniref:Aca2/YdiL-like domain-containing protein n=1 Tax=Nocardia TaxID=1817 RepID=UPI001892DE4B|nr:MULTISPECIES: DUF1870 family protein [Nocardia]MBF6216420.1 DUF1870 family protein [Nocardia puris]MBF6422393.1 DUF1870 family protein [Nocardia farcinica]MBF6434094.1 DUF1870 family protein [Nocardia farcinica]MBF6505150.1 DUF1870 family protein [Nocardia farcinica]
MNDSSNDTDDDLDIEGRPIGPMTAAGFKVVREFLGLTTRWLADTLSVPERTVQRWDNGESPVPAWVRERIEEIEARTAAMVTAAIDHLNDQRDPAILTYRKDADYRAHHPEVPWPASWHRAVVARVAQEVPGLAIEFWSPDDER